MCGKRHRTSLTWKQMGGVFSWQGLGLSLEPPDQACTCVQDLVDSDTLLDEDDLKKPDPASLRATCGDGAVKKKKACKDWLEKQLDLKTF